MTDPVLRRPFQRFGTLDLPVALVLLLGFSIVRGALVLIANATGSYSAVSAVFVAMIVLPWVLLTAAGRRAVGIVRPRWWTLPLALVAGAAACAALVGGAFAVWGTGIENPFVYIARSFAAIPQPLSSDDRMVYFVIFALIGMTFSPIGEELLYRGVVHRGLASAWGGNRASVVDAAAFALVHLAHFGIVVIGGVWTLLPLPALLWVLAMFLSALLFTAFRRCAGSIWGAVAAHAGFNLAMNAAIFAWLL